MSPAAVPPLMSSDEVNLLIYSYLAESCLDHSAFTLYSESRLDDFVNPSHSNEEDSSSITPPQMPPTGHLIRILQKGLLYLQAEAKYRGEDISANPPRLLGYAIPDTLPLPALPKSLPPPSPPPPSSTNNRKRQQQRALSISNNTNAAASTSTSSNLKRKESSKNGNNGSATTTAGDAATRSASEDLPAPNAPKKQRMAAKSPGASTSITSNAMQEAQAQAQAASASTSTMAVDSTEDQQQASSTQQQEAQSKTGTETQTQMQAITASASNKSRKGKGKAMDGSNQGDSEMTGVEMAVTSTASASNSKPPSNAGSANGSEKAGNSTSKGASSSSTFNKSALPTTASMAAAVAKKLDGTNSSSERRSTSPTTTTASRKTSTSGQGGVSTSANTGKEKDKNRPRSASPNTSLRSSISSSAANGAKSTLNNSTTFSQQPPTLDSSKPASTSTTTTSSNTLPSRNDTSKKSPPTTETKSTSTSSSSSTQVPAPKLTPKHIVDKKEVITLKGHTMPVQPCHWNPKVETLLATGSGDSTMRIWDVPDAAGGSPISSTVVCKHSSGQRRSDVTAVEWNKDGSLLASGSEDGIARIWTPSGDLHLVLSMHQRTIFCVKWNNTGSMLLTGSLDHSICLWDTGYGKVKQQWSTHADSILDLDWMTDEIFASCSMDKMINIHQVGRNTPVYRFKGHSDEVNCIRFCPTNRHLASCSDDNTVRVWSLQPVKNVLGLKDEDVKKEGSDEAPSSDASTNGSSEKDRPFLVLRGHEKEVHAVSWCPRTEFSNDSPKLLASASFDATARVWDALNGTCLHVFSRHTDMVYSLAWQPEKGDYLATGSNDKKMCVLKVPRKSSSSSSTSIASINAKGEEADKKEESEAENKEKNKESGNGQYELMLEYEHPGPIYEICWHPSRDQIAVCGKYESVNVVNFKLPA